MKIYVKIKSNAKIEMNKRKNKIGTDKAVEVLIQPTLNAYQSTF
jgi:hypothetical protein